MKKKQIECETLITEQGKKWLYDNVPCITSYDFTGYLFTVDPKKGIACAVGLNGQLYIYSINMKRPDLSKRLFKRAIKTLIKNKFCCFDIQPFKELNMVPCNVNNMLTVHDYLFSGFKEYE